MLVLGIETSGSRGSVALVRGDQSLLELAHEEANAHAERLVPLVSQLFDQTGVSKHTVDRVAVGKGPGSFTGLRVGIALGQGIAMGLGKPIVGVSSLANLATATHAPPGTLRCAVIDARRGELFFAMFSPDGRQVTEVQTVPHVHAESAMRSAAARAPFIVIGDAGRATLPQELLLSTQGPPFPTASACALLAQNAANYGAASPEYVRPADAIRPNLPPNPLAATRDSKPN